MSNENITKPEVSITVGAPISPEEVNKIIKISDDFYTIFSNHVRVAMAEDDFRFFFGEIYPTATNEIQIIEHLCVVMSPQKAKAVVSVLIQTMNAYEKLYGPIKPPTIIPTGTTITVSPNESPSAGTK